MSVPYPHLAIGTRAARASFDIRIKMGDIRPAFGMTNVPALTIPPPMLYTSFTELSKAAKARGNRLLRSVPDATMRLAVCISMLAGCLRQRLFLPFEASRCQLR